jgi:hypothetical protein
LARIPLSTQPNQIPEVITHYTTSAVKNIERTIKGYKIDKGTHRRQLDHYQWSVIKNREVFLKEIKPEYISSLTFHKPIAGQSSTETGTFDQTRLQNVGKNVGTDHYLSGFRAGGKKEALKPKPLTSAPQAEKDQYQHYLSGYQDGQSYREGYDLGENNGQIPDKKDYRKTQGFWDGKYGRDKKWEKV